MGTLRLWVFLVGGCGKIVMSNPDASTADGQIVNDDAPVASVWATPTRIDVLSTTGYRDTVGTVRGDLCEMYFMTDRRGPSEIWVSSRFAATLPWEDPTPVNALNALGSVSSPELSADGRTLIFSLSVGSHWDLYITTRSSPTSAWATPQAITELNTTATESQAELAADGKTIWFARTITGSSYDIHVATRPSLTALWENVRDVPRLNSTASDENPTSTGDELTLYFDSERDGGMMNMYKATRDPGMPWNAPVPVPELAGAFRADVTPDDRYMVLSMAGPDAMSDLYETHRVP